MKYLILLLLFSCSSEPEPEKPCNPECGKLIDTRHFREEQEIKLMYVSECNDTITNQFKLNNDQLGNDNGIQFYVTNFKVGDNYCE